MPSIDICKTCGSEFKQWGKGEYKYFCSTACRRTMRSRLYYHNMKLTDFLALLDKYAGLCDLCGKAVKGTPHVDHCHKTGRFRGLLCRPCNTSLGHFSDDVEKLQRAIDYLQRK